MSAFDAFFFGMVNGRGWICIAFVNFAIWQSGKALIGALQLGMFDALQARLQTEAGALILPQIFLMMPFILLIIALVIVVRRSDYRRHPSPHVTRAKDKKARSRIQSAVRAICGFREQGGLATLPANSAWSRRAGVKELWHLMNAGLAQFLERSMRAERNMEPPKNGLVHA